ncbi:hypothetical protein [Steroidobacter agaridevorans]|uniref:hypothetical protein n=1 Tax=Steroidobacter agaridevorans TaxID=2695856 RepID=UPI001325C21B|nr:hypothetical protein [Steroidobacter agaridevorans]GFE91327.1 hypothetical protein GCM10011488_62810 [Steroidobacter agaridevorans]
MRGADGAIAQLDGDRPVLVPPGVYDVAFDSYSTFMMFGRAPKVHLMFRIMTMGEHFEKPLSRFCNVKRLIGRPGPWGRFKVGFHSDFLREFAALFGTPVRLDRIPMSNFENHIFIATVRTVQKGSRQEQIPGGLTYSVIAKIRCIKQ